MSISNLGRRSADLFLLRKKASPLLTKMTRRVYEPSLIWSKQKKVTIAFADDSTSYRAACLFDCGRSKESAEMRGNTSIPRKG